VAESLTEVRDNGYSYYTSGHVHSAGEVTKVFADGVKIYEKGVMCHENFNPETCAIDEMPLMQFGNRVPTFKGDAE
jgi:hypothetical protein